VFAFSRNSVDGSNVFLGSALFCAIAALQQYKVNNMNKKILLAGAFCALAAQSAYAGGVAEPTMEQEVVVAETTASSGGVLLPLLLLVLIAVAVSGTSSAPPPV
jgi:hypothetical protein